MARGPKAVTVTHAVGRLLIVATAMTAAAVAVAALAAAGMMSEAAMAQTDEVKIGVLFASPDVFVEGPRAAMEMARDSWNRDALDGINAELKLEFINILGDPFSPTYPGFVAQKIGAAVQGGYTHFIAPSNDVALAVVQGVASRVLPDAILVSPASQATHIPSLHADDNLFRLAPNSATQVSHLVEQFDRRGVDKVIIITDKEFESFVVTGGFPDDVHGHYVFPPVLVYPSNFTAQNVQSMTDLNSLLADMNDRYGEGRVAVLAAMWPYSFVTMANVLADNPQLDAIRDVKWFGYSFLGFSDRITGDETAAKLADDVDMNVIVYEVARNDVNAPLSGLPAYNPGYANFNFASYDAVHLLADAIAIGGADNPNLRDVVYDVANNNVHAVPHTDRILGVGAIGDYVLDPATGDLLEARSYVAYNVVKSGDGYAWAPLAPPSACR